MPCITKAKKGGIGIGVDNLKKTVKNSIQKVIICFIFNFRLGKALHYILGFCLVTGKRQSERAQILKSTSENTFSLKMMKKKLHDRQKLQFYDLL